MNTMTNGMSPADFAAVMGNDGFGGGNGSWIWIFLIFAIFGGWGGGYRSGAGVQDGYIINSDFSSLSRQIDSQTSELMKQTTQIANGLCDGFYTNAQLINGVNMNLANGFAQAELSRSNGQAAIVQQMNAIGTQIGQGFCQTNYNNATNTRDVIDSQRAGTDAILAKLTQMESNAKDERIAALMADNQTLKFAQSQTMQNAYLVDKLKPCPIPAYVVQNPYCGCQYAAYSGTTVV